MRSRISYKLFFLILPAVVISYWFFDQSAALWCHHSLTQNNKDVFQIITRFGESHYYLISAAILFVLAHHYWEKPPLANLALLVIAAVIFSGISADIIKVIAGRYRPGELIEHGLYGFTFFQMQHSMTSFPSGHTATIFSLATLITTIWPKSSLYVWFFAIIVGISRIALNAHYPSDVLAGAFIGILSTQILIAYWNPSKIFKNSRSFYHANRYYYLPFIFSVRKKNLPQHGVSS